MDYAICIDLLGLNTNTFSLSKVHPPHTIINWSGPDSQPTEAECQVVWDRYEADQLASQYQRDRTYPSVGDQLDMIYHDQVNGTTTFKDAIEAIKAKYPKP